MLSVQQSVTPTARTGTVPQWVSRLSQSHTTPQTRVFTRHCPTRRCVRRHGHETRNNFHPCSVTPPCIRAMLTRHLNPCCEPSLIPYLAWQAQYGVTRTPHQKLVVIPLDGCYVCICDAQHFSVSVHWERFQENRQFWPECHGVTVVFICSRWFECCFTSTETVGLSGNGAQDGHLDFHTVPELWLL